MNEETLIELGVASEETKGSPAIDRFEVLNGCDWVDVLNPQDC